jgi:hypothetical protein
LSVDWGVLHAFLCFLKRGFEVSAGDFVVVDAATFVFGFLAGLGICGI